MNRAEKAQEVSSLRDVFAGPGTVIVTHYSGLNVSQLTDLRGRMMERGAAFRVVKNRLVKLAIVGAEAEGLGDLLTGPTAIAFSEDPVAAPKIVADFAKEHENLIIRGGIMGDVLLDVAAVKALADLPSLDELRGRLVGMIQTPATRIAGVLQAPAGQLARVMGAYAASD
ncbi:MAG: 50S ribosomal protein L10 [Parvularculales bacterium]